MEDELAAILETIESWQESRDGIRQRAAEWISSSMFLTTFYDNAHAPVNARSYMREHASAKEVDRLWKEFRGLGEQSPDLLAQYRELGRSGRVAFAHGVITNPGFNSTVIPQEDGEASGSLIWRGV